MTELFVVATPIGNLQDITLRALETLRLCDIIICEDTRITARLLEKYEIKNKKLLVYNDNSDEKARKKILHELLSEKKIALVSDAGTPLISDPGHKLIEFLRKYNVRITPIAGASAVLAALCASGLACDNFLFIGFLPNTKIQRLNQLKELPKNYTLVFFEAPQRILETLQDINEVFAGRKIAVARELTKIHEEIICDESQKILQFFEENPDKIRGEFVIVVEKAARGAKAISAEDLQKEIKKMIKAGYGVKELSTHLAEIYSLHKKEVYQLALKLS